MVGQRMRRRRFGRLMRGGVAALAALAVLVGGAAPAEAKGLESLTITGPGLDDPIEVSLSSEGADAAPPYVIVALMELAGPYDLASRAVARDATPTGDLHERFTLTWTMHHPSDADPAAYTVVQDVYPNAAFGGPFIHLRASSYAPDMAAGWFEAHPAHRDTLAALGTPVDPDTLSPATAHSLTTPTPTAAAEPPPPATAGLSPWPLALATTTGLAVGITLTHHRHRTP